MPTTLRRALWGSRALLAALLVLGLAVCGRNQQSTGTIPEDTMGLRGSQTAPPAPATPPPGVQISPPEPELPPPGAGVAPYADPPPPEAAALLAATDSAELRPSRLALEKAEDPRVQAFARRMLADHGMLEDSLRALDARQHIVPAPGAASRALDAETARTLQTLERLSGPAFDRRYVQAMVASHQKALGTIDSALLPSAKDPEVRTYLERTVRPVVAAHLEEARALQRALGGR
jgi:putative membrane protein